MKTSEEQYVFIRLHLGDCITEFVNYKKLDRQLANEIELAIVDIVKDAFNKLPPPLTTPPQQ